MKRRAILTGIVIFLTIAGCAGNGVLRRSSKDSFVKIEVQSKMIPELSGELQQKEISYEFQRRLWEQNLGYFYYVITAGGTVRADVNASNEVTSRDLKWLSNLSLSGVMSPVESLEQSQQNISFYILPKETAIQYIRELYGLDYSGLESVSLEPQVIEDGDSFKIAPIEFDMVIPVCKIKTITETQGQLVVNGIIGIQGQDNREELKYHEPMPFSAVFEHNPESVYSSYRLRSLEWKAQHDQI